MSSGRTILVIGTEPWFGPMLSKQHVTLELCKQNRVLYVEPVYHVGNLLRLRLPGHVYSKPYHHVQPENLSRIRPWRFPKSGASAVMRWLSQTTLRARLDLRGWNPDVIISFSPDFAFLANWWSAPFIYYCVDTQWNKIGEAGTLACADLTVAATEKLYNEFQGRTRRLEYLPHGVNCAALDESARCVPPDLSGIPRPVAGFVGTLNSQLDVNLVVYLAESRPDISTVLIGPYDPVHGYLCAGSLARLQALPNVFLLGPRPSEQVGSYIYHLFDVGLLPYDVNHPRVHFSYHKVLQYLAMGKPAVTSCEASAEVLPPHVSVAQDAPGFVEAVDQALGSHDAQAAEECRAFAREQSWEKRVRQLSAWMDDLL